LEYGWDGTGKVGPGPGASVSGVQARASRGHSGPEHLRFWGRQPLQISVYVEWCEHRVEGIPAVSPS